MEAIDLSDSAWELSVTSFTQDPDNPNNRQGLRTLLDTISLNEGLQSWLTLDGLETVSGTGIYSTTFQIQEWDGTQTADLVLDAYGEIGYVESCYWHENGRVSYTNGTDGTSAILSVKVNGSDAGTVNQTTQTVSIGDYLQTGDNTLEIEISTTLYNTRYAEGVYEYGIESALVEIRG